MWKIPAHIYQSSSGERAAISDDTPRCSEARLLPSAVNCNYVMRHHVIIVFYYLDHNLDNCQHARHRLNLTPLSTKEKIFAHLRVTTVRLLWTKMEL